VDFIRAGDANLDGSKLIAATNDGGITMGALTGTYGSEIRLTTHTYSVLGADIQTDSVTLDGSRIVFDAYNDIYMGNLSAVNASNAQIIASGSITAGSAWLSASTLNALAENGSITMGAVTAQERSLVTLDADGSILTGNVELSETSRIEATAQTGTITLGTLTARQASSASLEAEGDIRAGDVTLEGSMLDALSHSGGIVLGIVNASAASEAGLEAEGDIGAGDVTLAGANWTRCPTAAALRWELSTLRRLGSRAGGGGR
jgi:hypothetical protein